jgi:hypothetical protein
MFDELEIHKRCNPVTFAELLMGYSPLCMMPPTQCEPLMQILDSADRFADPRDELTTEEEYGQEVRYA